MRANVLPLTSAACVQSSVRRREEGRVTLLHMQEDYHLAGCATRVCTYVAANFIRRPFRTFDGPLPTVSTPPIRFEYAQFAAFFRELQDVHSFVPLESRVETTSKTAQKIPTKMHEKA